MSEQPASSTAYACELNADLNGLCINLGPDARPNSTSITIPNTSVVALLPSSTAESYTLLYVSSSPLASLGEITITNPPSFLVQHYLLTALPPHLDPKTADVTVLCSTASGGEDSTAAESYWTALLSPLLLRLSIPSTFVRTVSATSVTSAARTLSTTSTSSKPQTLLLLSGDTSIHEALNAVPASGNLVLAIFPLGTGNALASSLHTVRGVSPLSALLLGRAHPLPLFRARFSAGAKWVADGSEIKEGVSGAVVLSWGFHAALVADADALRGSGLGVDRFKVAARQNLEDAHAYRGRVSLLLPEQPQQQEGTGNGDGKWETIDRPDGAFYVLATLVSSLEPTFMISPESKPGEDLLRVVEFAPMPPDQIMQVMGGAYNRGAHVKDERVGYHQARGIRIEMREDDERWRRVCVDGAIACVAKHGWVEAEMVQSENKRVDVVWSEKGWEEAVAGREA